MMLALPDKLENFTHLTKLSISSGNLFNLPNSLSSLTNLTDLVVEGNCIGAVCNQPLSLSKCVPSRGAGLERAVV